MSTLTKVTVFNGPYNVSVENRLVPSIRAPTDIIVKVSYAAICVREKGLQVFVSTEVDFLQGTFMYTALVRSHPQALS